VKPPNREEILKDLCERYYRAVVKFFLDFGFPLEDARDLAQEVFFRVCKSVKDYRGEAGWAYLKKTAVRTALNEVRRRRTEKRSGLEVSLDGDPTMADFLANDSLSPEGELLIREKLRMALAELPDTIQPCLQLRMKERSYREIKDELGLSMDAVKGRLNEARKRLRARFGVNSRKIRLSLRTPEVDRDQES
jgi:RNA polymerase sigma factor (sigma-70 family)